MVPTERAVLASIWLVPLHSLGQEPSPTYYVRLSFVVKLPFSGVRAVYIIITIKKASAMGGFFYGADRETRTPDPLITNQ